MKPRSFSALFIKTQIIFLSLCLFSLSQCKKDTDGPGVEAGSGKVTMKVDGAAWTSKDAVNGAVIAQSQGTTTLQAYADNDSQISFGLPTPAPGSTWDFNSGGSMVYKLNVNDPGYVFLPGSGRTASITFNTFSAQKAQGTFSGTLVQFDNMGNTTELEITDGNFDVNF